MQHRGPLLLITGALAFGSLGYFLFLYDDGTQPRGGQHARPKKIGAGAASANGAGLMGPAPSGSPRIRVMPNEPNQSVPAPAPTPTGPPE